MNHLYNLLFYFRYYNKRKAVLMRSIFVNNYPIIGCVHLRALPGSPGYEGDLSIVYDQAIKEAKLLAEEGVDALIIENFGDAPFYNQKLPPVTVACMAAVAKKISEEVSIPIGINALRNDAAAALSIAVASNAKFIRVNIHMHAMLTDQGIIQGMSYETLRLRSALKADHIKIFADINVKHAHSIVEPDLIQWTLDLTKRGKADALIVSGSGTGTEADIEELDIVNRHSSVPVLLGSGVNPDNIGLYRRHSQGAIIGSYFKEEGIVTNGVDRNRVKTLLNKLDR